MPNTNQVFLSNLYTIFSGTYGPVLHLPRLNGPFLHLPHLYGADLRWRIGASEGLSEQRPSTEFAVHNRYSLLAMPPALQGVAL